MKNKPLSIFLFIFILSCFFQNCKRDSSCTYTTTTQHYYNLKESNKSRIPYTGLDTLIFISNLGDTATLIGQNKDHHYIKRNSGLSNADCGIPQDEYNYENVDYNYSSNNPFFNNLIFSIYMNNVTNDLDFEDIRILSDYFSKYSTFEYVDHTTQMKDSVFVAGIVQYGVYLEISENKSILFNFEKGILKITDSNNRIWIKNN